MPATPLAETVQMPIPALLAQLASCPNRNVFQLALPDSMATLLPTFAWLVTLLVPLALVN